MRKLWLAVAVALALSFGAVQDVGAQARTDLSIRTLTNQTFTVPANSADFTFAAADVANGNAFSCTGKELLLVQNSDPTNPYTVTIAGVADSYGRTASITAYSLAAGEFAVFGPFPIAAFKQSTGKTNVDASNVAIKLAVLRFP